MQTLERKKMRKEKENAGEKGRKQSKKLRNRLIVSTL